MKNKKIFIGLLVMVFIIGFFTFQEKRSNEKEMAEAAKECIQKTAIVKELSKEVQEGYIKNHFPAVKKIFSCKDQDGNMLGKVFIVNPLGYKGEIKMAVGIDEKTKETTRIKIISHNETPQYGGVLTEKWFLDRLNKKSVMAFLNLVKLDANNPQDIIQITGATVTSKAVVNGINAAIGAFNYLDLNKEMPCVSEKVSMDDWVNEKEMFYINGKNGSIKISMDELKKLTTVKAKCILKKSTGTEIEVTAEGPTLDVVLKHFGENLKDYKGIGATARDGYYAMISKEIMDNRKIILAYKINGKDIEEEEKPIRVVIPEEMGVYWVRMVSSIDLYEDIAQKDIKSVKMFDALTRDIEPYRYEYYGSKDAAIEIGKILAKFKDVNQKGFFTMASSDGLVKNETITMVSQRYYIKIDGKNAPMNIAPNFKLGMNVKNMAYFSTTHDGVIFPKEMMKLTGKGELGEFSGMSLDKVLEHVGILDVENKKFELIGVNGERTILDGKSLNQCILSYDDKIVTAVYKKENGIEKIEDLLEINEIQ